MDFQNRVGSKTGGGGPASWSESNRDRRERLAALAAETIDLAKVCRDISDNKDDDETILLCRTHIS